MDLNHRPLGYEPSELPGCSTPPNLDAYDYVTQPIVLVALPEGHACVFKAARADLGLSCFIHVSGLVAHRGGASLQGRLQSTVDWCVATLPGVRHGGTLPADAQPSGKVTVATSPNKPSRAEHNRASIRLLTSFLGSETPPIASKDTLQDGSCC